MIPETYKYYTWKPQVQKLGGNKMNEKATKEWRNYQKIEGSMLRLDNNPLRNGILFLRSNCSNKQHNYFIPDNEIKNLANLSINHKTNRVVIIGGCEESEQSHVSEFRLNASKLGIDLVWLDFEQTKCLNEGEDGPMSGPEMVNKFLTDKNQRPYKLNLRSWKAIKEAAITLPYLVNQARKIKEISINIEKEKELLNWSRGIYKVESLTMPHSSIMNTLFGDLSYKESKSKVIVLFDIMLDKCIIVTKSMSFSGKRIIDKGSYTIIEDDYSKFRISVKFAKGNWKITPHPRLDITDPKVRYIPMYDRLVQEKDKEH